MDEVRHRAFARTPHPRQIPSGIFLSAKPYGSPAAFCIIIVISYFRTTPAVQILLRFQFMLLLLLLCWHKVMFPFPPIAKKEEGRQKEFTELGYRY
jgi:hypothetical protein